MDRRQFLSVPAAGLAASATRAQAPVKAHSRIVVDGSNSSLINREFLAQARSGGAHCVHKSVHTYLEAGQMKLRRKYDLSTKTQFMLSFVMSLFGISVSLIVIFMGVRVL